MKIFLLIVLVLTALVLWLAQRQRREALRRQRVISQLLDAPPRVTLAFLHKIDDSL